MPSVKNAITDLSGLRTLAFDKAARAESSRTDQQIQRSQAKAAESRIEQAEATVQRYELEKSKAEDDLTTPPKKTVTGGGGMCGGGSREVDDQNAISKIKAKLRAADLQVQQGRAAVEAAKAEADESKNNILVSAGLTEQQGSEMGSLESQISELEALANNENTDLTGDEYQNKLKKAKAETERLAKTLPDTANAALTDFWEGIGNSWGNIQEKITEQITPKAADVKSANNYEGFFNDAEQGYDKIIEHLEANGESPEVVNSVKSSRNLVLGKSDTYLGGMTDGDDASLSALLTHMNTMVEYMGTEGLTAEDIANLNILSDETNSVLESGGRAFEDVIAIPFRTAAVNLDGFAQDLAANDDFANMYTRFNGIYSGGNSFGQLQGITKDEVDEINNFVELTDTINEIYRDGGTPSDEQIQSLVSQGNSLADSLETRYGFNSSIDDGSNGGLRGGSGSSRRGGSSRRYNGLR